MPRLLIVDDEPNLLYSLQKSLQSESLQVLTAPTARQALEIVAQDPPEAVVLDVRLPDMSGLDAFDLIRQRDPGLPVIMVTAFATTETAIEAMKRGAFEYLLKPLDFYQLRDVVTRAVETCRLRRVPAVFEEADGAPAEVDLIVGRSASMQEIYKKIGRVARQDVAVLIVGESGTGKELVARAIYHHSGRNQAPLLAMNCAAIPESLLESELFGHEQGAFTGAIRRRIGKFEQADRGTVVLDEVGDMGSAIQAKMLRLLQEQCFERLGGNETIRTHVRIIAITNQNLEDLVARGRFRQDLYYRLKGFLIRVPPLRERLDDLPLLVDHFLKVFNQQLKKQIRPLPPESLAVLSAHSWPGNVRELQGVIKYGMLHATGDVLTPECLHESLQSNAMLEAQTMSPGQSDFDLLHLLRQLVHKQEPEIYRKICLSVDRVVLEEVLQYVKGNQVQASELLGISRTTLRAKLQEMGLAIEKQVQKLSRS